MATKTIRLTIPTPCQQRWQDMKAEGAGRFCASCQKTVVDFSTLTDQEIVKQLTRKNDSACGRFRVDQLDRKLTGPAPASQPPIRLFGLLTAGLLGYQTAQAGAMPSIVELTKPPVTLSPIANALPPITEETPLTDSLRVITGRVVSQADNVTVPGATVAIKGTSTGANTDAAGKFRVNIPANYDGKVLTLQISWIGYKTTEIQVSPDQSTPLLVILAEDQVALMGEVTVGGYKKLTFFQRLRNRLRSTH